MHIRGQAHVRGGDLPERDDHDAELHRVTTSAGTSSTTTPTTRRRCCRPAPSSTSSAGTTTRPANRYNPDPKNWVGFGNRSIDDMSFAWMSFFHMPEDEFERRLEERAPSRPTTDGGRGWELRVMTASCVEGTGCGRWTWRRGARLGRVAARPHAPVLRRSRAGAGTSRGAARQAPRAGVRPCGRRGAGVPDVRRLGSGLAAATDAGAQTYHSGQNLQPVFEGWEQNADGSFNMVFGYLNRNYEEHLRHPGGAGQPLRAGRSGSRPADVLLSAPAAHHLPRPRSRRLGRPGARLDRHRARADRPRGRLAGAGADHRRAGHRDEPRRRRRAGDRERGRPPSSSSRAPSGPCGWASR